MAYKVTGAPAKEPVTLTEAKAHLRIEQEIDDEDDYVTALITAAREQVEIYCNRALITQTVQLKTDRFPGFGAGDRQFAPYADFGIPSPGYGSPGYNEMFFRAGIFLLPLPPTQSVASVKYLDRDGVLQTIDPSEYVLDEFNEPARLAPMPGFTWPLSRVAVLGPVINAVTVEFKAGYGDTADTVPETLKLAMKIIIGHLYENREAVLTGTRAQAIEIPFSARALMQSKRVFSFV